MNKLFREGEFLIMDPAGIMVFGIFIILLLAAIFIPQIQKRRSTTE